MVHVMGYIREFIPVRVLGQDTRSPYCFKKKKIYCMKKKENCVFVSV